MGMHWLSGDASLPARLPLPWAAALMIIIVLPFGLYLGEWNVPLWVCFIVWTEYFILGADRSTWKIILPSLAFGAGVAAVWIACSVALSGTLAPHLGGTHAAYAAYALTNLVFVPIVFYLCQWVPTFTTGTLAVFNGFSLLFAVYFTGAVPSFGPMENPLYVVLWTYLWTLAMAYVGWGFGWVNVFLTFPHPAPQAQAEGVGATKPRAL